MQSHPLFFPLPILCTYWISFFPRSYLLVMTLYCTKFHGIKCYLYVGYLQIYISSTNHSYDSRFAYLATVWHHHLDVFRQLKINMSRNKLLPFLLSIVVQISTNVSSVPSVLESRNLGMFLVASNCFYTPYDDFKIHPVILCYFFLQMAETNSLAFKSKLHLLAWL